jgi:hypothetical protein
MLKLGFSPLIVEDEGASSSSGEKVATHTTSIGAAAIQATETADHNDGFASHGGAPLIVFEVGVAAIACAAARAAHAATAASRLWSELAYNPFPSRADFTAAVAATAAADHEQKIVAAAATTAAANYVANDDINSPSEDLAAAHTQRKRKISEVASEEE